MNILLLQPNAKNIKCPKILGRDFSLKLNSPPLGMMILASCLEKEGHKMMIIDADAEGLDDYQIIKLIEHYNPHIVGLYINSFTLPPALIIAKEIKRKNSEIKIIIGGTLSEYYPKQLLKYSCFDIGIIGEGEETICELVSALKKNKDLSRIKGIVYKKNKRVYITKKREINSNLDKLPFPAWHLVKIGVYKRINTKYKTHASLIINRGCCFNCIFCDTPTKYNHRITSRSVKNIISELKLLHKIYKKKDIVFLGENFTVNKKIVLGICNEIVKNDINISWQCRTRVNLVDEDLIKAMSKAGCYLIAFGVESGNDEILKIIKKDITKEQVKKAITLAKKYKIETIGNFMIGHPYETKETIKDTINFAIESDPTFAAFHLTNVFSPKTELAKWAEKKGFHPYKRRDRFKAPSGNKVDIPVIETSNLDKRTIYSYYKKAFFKFYFRPTKIFYCLSNHITKNVVCNFLASTLTSSPSKGLSFGQPASLSLLFTSKKEIIEQ